MQAFDARRVPTRNRGSLDPQLTRRGALSHPGAILLTILACIFTAYVFGLLPFLDTAFSSAVHNTQNKEKAVVGSITNALPYLLAFFAALVLVFAALRLKAAMTAMRVASFLRHREPVSLARFQLEAREAGICKKVATEAYHLLTPRYGKAMRIRLDDRLSADLRLSQHAILDAAGNLLARCDRMRRPGESAPQSPTVLEWMEYVERSRPAFAPMEPEQSATPPSRGRDPLKSFIAPLRLPVQEKKAAAPTDLPRL